MPEPYRRPAFDALLARAREPRRFMQVLAGPRQVGKTTLARQVNGAIDLPAHHASADEPTLQDAAWTRAQGEARRDRELWGRLVESAVGAHLVNTGEVERLEVSYWRERGRESNQHISPPGQYRPHARGVPAHRSDHPIRFEKNRSGHLGGHRKAHQR